MKYFYLYIFMLCCFILAVSYYNTYTKEPFNSSKQTIVLLGDSILKNNSYTSNGKSVQELLEERTKGKTYCFAMDDSKINDVYNQIGNIPENLNTPYTTIFLSIGGNNILAKYKENITDNNTNDLNSIFKSYLHLVQSIQSKMNKTKIILLDIYYPNDSKYKSFHHLINEWNEMIYEYAANSKNNIDGVLRISSIIRKPEDFSQEIEPSDRGGEKIVDAILTF
jgi:hypothetical protein